MDIPSPSCWRCGKSIAISQLIFPNLKAGIFGIDLLLAAWGPFYQKYSGSDLAQGGNFAQLFDLIQRDVRHPGTRATIRSAVESLTPIFSGQPLTAEQALNGLLLDRYCCRDLVANPPLVPRPHPVPPPESHVEYRSQLVRRVDELTFEGSSVFSVRVIDTDNPEDDPESPAPPPSRAPVQIVDSQPLPSSADIDALIRTAGV